MGSSEDVLKKIKKGLKIGSSADLLKKVRVELKPLSDQILTHPFIEQANAGNLPRAKIKRFAEQQYYIVSNDARSLASMLSRARGDKELELFSSFLKADLEALPKLVKMADGMGIPTDQIEDVGPIVEAVAYSHYLAFLASSGTIGENAFALIANIPVWGKNCKSLASSLNKNYGLKEVSFLEAFSLFPKKLEDLALEVIQEYLPSGAPKMRRAASVIQRYELMFWDAISI